MASAEPARVECTRFLVGEEILREIPVPSPSTFQVQTGLSIGFGLLSESKDAFLLGPVWWCFGYLQHLINIWWQDLKEQEWLKLHKWPPNPIYCMVPWKSTIHYYSLYRLIYQTQRILHGGWVVYLHPFFFFDRHCRVPYTWPKLKVSLALLSTNTTP